jgi:hypothetical protein
VRCLTDIQIQQLADGENATVLGPHVAHCTDCAARLDERRRLMATLTSTIPADVPSSALPSRVRDAVHAARSARGATVLRPAWGPRKPLWASAIATAAAAAIIMFVVLPRVDAPATLSAAQILDRSLEQMTGGTGVEVLEYELVLASDYRRPIGLSEGPYRIVQLFDRSNPARYKLAQFDRNEVLVAATAQDPARGRRTEMHRIDGRNFIVRVTSLPGPMVSLPQLLQTQAASILRLMQINADEHLSVLEDSSGVHYVIELPGLPAAAAGTPLVLSRARVDIDGGDFRVREFSGRGALLGLPFEVSFKLIAQVKAASVLPGEWEIDQGPEDVVIEGDGSGEADDSLTVVLRELARMQGR